MAQSSEVHSYVYIKKELAALGWKVGNPSKHADGQVFTQNECQQDPILKKYLGLVLIKFHRNTVRKKDKKLHQKKCTLH